MLDRAVTPKHGEAFDAITTLSTSLSDRASPLLRTPIELRGLRVFRMGITSLFVVLILGYAMHRLLRLRIDASASEALNADAQANHVVDDDTATEWLLPDNTTGWVDLRLRKRRHVHALRIMNAKNDDKPLRATRAYRIELFADNNLAQTLDGTLVPESQEWVTVPTNPDPLVERVRFTVKSWAGAGGGLAEIEVE
jgi:hypothetical protein